MQSAVRDRPRTPQALFTRVAPYYDLMNSVLSFGRDRRWRRAAVGALELGPGARVLDVATGTGALAAELARANVGVCVSACDLNEGMLARAGRRVNRAGLSVELLRCDATELPFDDDSFDAVTLAFAIDDILDRSRCVQEMYRVLRPGGRVALLELGQPDSGWLRDAFQLYLRLFHLVRLGWSAYGHLEQEILGWRSARAVQSLLARGRFVACTHHSLSHGIARLYLARKPPLALH
ncbi:ubiquinone/menaquinone biosynthesis methyltransferase [Aquabacterium sp. A7-Y]|uniref:ubiquinone/menaquinone biosynthesis methyltransferase n=1 Tax=Aquabacterium sp. A7-Y TaxID=1349605 RepID=UPI00223E0CAF|nr:ubiquinone/menaquinone biosynthesis methyltransferase [Aquabacterium sp. A7-Y]MCW7539332.1 ubiquinone/menaquinone biosynthesis methyltransferase [Aquabacterium sp. A7-Y]